MSSDMKYALQEGVDQGGLATQVWNDAFLQLKNLPFIYENKGYDVFKSDLDLAINESDDEFHIR